MKRLAESVWKGSGKEGKGHLSVQSGVLDKTPYSFKLRFENEDGKAGTNPEELIGAAHAGCFNMALAVALSEAGHEPEELNTKAHVSLEKTDEGFSISKIQLSLSGRIPGISEDEFQELAESAKKNCPVSKALGTVDIQLDAKLQG